MRCLLSMEGHESALRSYYPHPHHHTSNPTANPASTNGMFPNAENQNQNPNPHVSSPHYSSSEHIPLGFSPHSVAANRGLLPSSAPPPPPETVKRKRGRPRKYGTPEAPSSTPSSAQNISSPPRKKDASSVSSLTSCSKKAQLFALGNAGHGFTPHIINVAVGEDAAQKILSFVQQGNFAVCILSASGSISNASLRQPALLGGNVTYEGRFEILSLSGSFLHSELGGVSSRTGGLTVCLSATDGRIIGGGVGGPLIAAGPVQVIAGSFFYHVTKTAIGDGQPKASLDKSPPQVPGASITSVTFRDAPGDHQSFVGHFMLQPRGIDMTSPRSTDWWGGLGASSDIEFAERTEHGECQSPDDGDDEQLDG